MDAASAGKLTVFDAAKTEKCCDAEKFLPPGYEAGPLREGTEPFVSGKHCTPRNEGATLNTERFTRCCGADFKYPNQDITASQLCCGGRGKTEIKKVTNSDEARELLSSSEKCVIQSDKIPGRHGPWIFEGNGFLNAQIDVTPEESDALVNTEVALLQKYECPKDTQSTFSGAWFQSGEKTALYTDAQFAPKLGWKEPFDEVLPPIKIPFYNWFGGGRPGGKI
ncbi:MAG: hypothetical protein M1837_006691 [Sclerophora amabilis]|nr:MAG: hypothetical protein M1837_006691 [Sclerophora amabilis]